MMKTLIVLDVLLMSVTFRSTATAIVGFESPGEKDDLYSHNFF
jgi:hypothetical protein